LRTANRRSPTAALLTLKRPFTLFHSRVTVADALGQTLATVTKK